MGIYQAYYIFYGCILTKEEYDKLTNISEVDIKRIGSKAIIIALSGSIFKDNGFIAFTEEEYNTKNVKWERTHINKQLFEEKIANRDKEANNLTSIIGKPFQRILCETIITTFDLDFSESISNIFLLV